MPHRTLDLLKTTDITQHAQEPSEEGPSGRVCRIAVEAGRAGFSGWYRLKLFSSESLLRRVSIEALDDRAERIFAFESVTPGRNFSGYIFSGISVSSIGIRAYLDSVQKSDLIATF